MSGVVQPTKEVQADEESAACQRRLKSARWLAAVGGDHLFSFAAEAVAVAFEDVDF